MVVRRLRDLVPRGPAPLHHDREAPRPRRSGSGASTSRSAWGIDIVNFVWWIGIGHAGTLISAILLLLRQTWRTSINRFAEAMTLFAVAAAAQFVLFHTGRQWLAVYWLFPYPNTMGVWPQFRSPLMWDVFAVSTYATISALFWFVGLIPDLATLRDRSKHWFGKITYGMLAMGWRGSARHWHNYETASLLLAGPRDAARRLRPHRRELRLRGRHHSGLARHDLPALLRRGRDLLRLRDGDDARDPAPQGVRARGLHHDAAPAEHGQDHARDGPHRGVRLRDRAVHGLVQREHVRAIHDAQPDPRAVRLDLVPPHPVQRPHAAVPVAEEGPQLGPRRSSSSRSS